MLQVRHVSKAVDPESCSSGAPIKEDGASGVSLHHLATDPREAFQNLRMLMSFLLKDYFSAKRIRGSPCRDVQKFSFPALMAGNDN